MRFRPPTCAGARHRWFAEKPAKRAPEGAEPAARRTAADAPGWPSVLAPSRNVSKADCRSIAVSYLPRRPLFCMSCWRSSSLIGPTRAIGGAIRLRATISGLPLASSIETRASPTAKLGDRGGGIEGRVPAERIRRRLDRFLVARREGAQGVLHAIAELPENRLRHVGRILGDEINANRPSSGSAGQPVRSRSKESSAHCRTEDALHRKRKPVSAYRDRRPRAISRTIRTASTKEKSRRGAANASIFRRSEC